MKPPIFLFDHGDVSAFSSVMDLENYVESPDISEYSVFDAAGHKLVLKSASAEGGMILDVGTVTLVETSEEAREDVLRSSIESLLKTLNVPFSDKDELHTLIKILVGTIGYTK